MESEERINSLYDYSVSLSNELNKRNIMYEHSDPQHTNENESLDVESHSSLDKNIEDERLIPNETEDQGNGLNLVSASQHHPNITTDTDDNVKNEESNQNQQSSSHIVQNESDSGGYLPGNSYGHHYNNFPQHMPFPQYPYDRMTGFSAPVHPYPPLISRQLSEQSSGSQQQPGESFNLYNYQDKHPQLNVNNNNDEETASHEHPQSSHSSSNAPIDEGEDGSNNEDGMQGKRFTTCQRGLRLDGNGFPIKKNGKLYKTKGYIYEKARAYYEKRMATESPDEKAVRLEKARQRYYRKKEEREGLPMYHLGVNQPRRKHSSRYGQSPEGLNNNNPSSSSHSFPNNNLKNNSSNNNNNNTDQSVNETQNDNRLNDPNYFHHHLQNNHPHHPNLDPNVMFKLFPLLSQMNHPNPGGITPSAHSNASPSAPNYYNPFPGVNPSSLVNYNAIPQDLSATSQSESNNQSESSAGNRNPTYESSEQKVPVQESSVHSEHFGDLASKLAQFQRIRAMLDFQQQNGGIDPNLHHNAAALNFPKYNNFENEEKNITTSHGIDDIIP